MRSAIAPLADLFYGHPSGKLKVIGLTGTKGKSSTAYYLKYILDEYMAEREKPESGIISSLTPMTGWSGSSPTSPHPNRWSSNATLPTGWKRGWSISPWRYPARP